MEIMHVLGSLLPSDLVIPSHLDHLTGHKGQVSCKQVAHLYTCTSFNLYRL